MGYYNPIYIYGVDKLPRRCAQGRRCRRSHHRRPAARGRRRALPPGAEGRAQLHPPRDADHRRQAPAGGAREHLGLCLLRLDHRHHRLGVRRYAAQVAEAVGAHQAPHHAAGRGRLRRARRPQQAARDRAADADGVVVGSALIDVLSAIARCAGQGDAENRASRGRVAATSPGVRSATLGTGVALRALFDLHLRVRSVAAPRGFPKSVAGLGEACLSI